MTTDSGGRATINPAGLAVADLAKLLSQAGNRRVTAEQVRADVERGAPQNADGSIHLIHYTAWLARDRA